MINLHWDLADRTTEFGLSVIKIAALLPNTNVGRVIGNQVLRSGTSIGVNYREARRSRSRAEFIAKVGDCLKEADETAYWLEPLERSGVLDANKLTLLCDEINQTLRYLQEFIDPPSRIESREKNEYETLRIGNS